MEGFKRGAIELNDEEIHTLCQSSPHLENQTYDQISTITPLSKEVISRQATMNIGTIGHVAHGKSTLVRSISGKKQYKNKYILKLQSTVRFKQEKVKNITIRLGYANSKIFQCPKCPVPDCFRSFGSEKEDLTMCSTCNEQMILVRHVSFVDCPGHDILMSTMLTGAAVMDCALLIVAANMPCPQPQTQEHLVALVIMKLKYVIIVQNKVDIIFRDEKAAKRNFDEIKTFIKGTIAENAPIIPISAQLKYNIECVLQQICEYFPVPERALKVPPKMIIIRSFDVNKPGETAQNLKGGVVGGSILCGVLRVGDEVEIRPGQLMRRDNQIVCQPILSRVVSLQAEDNKLLYAVPGGLIGTGLLIDPSITRNDRLVGCVMGYPGKLPDLYVEIEVDYQLMRIVLGVKNEDGRQQRIAKVAKQETLKLNILSNETPGRVLDVKNDKNMRVVLNNPICTQINEKVAFSRRINNKWRLIGWGIIVAGQTLKI